MVSRRRSWLVCKGPFKTKISCVLIEQGLELSPFGPHSHSSYLALMRPLGWFAHCMRLRNTAVRQSSYVMLVRKCEKGMRGAKDSKLRRSCKIIWSQPFSRSCAWRSSTWLSALMVLAQRMLEPGHPSHLSIPTAAETLDPAMGLRRLLGSLLGLAMVFCFHLTVGLVRLSHSVLGCGCCPQYVLESFDCVVLVGTANSVLQCRHWASPWLTLEGCEWTWCPMVQLVFGACSDLGFVELDRLVHWLIPAAVLAWTQTCLVAVTWACAFIGPWAFIWVWNCFIWSWTSFCWCANCINCCTCWGLSPRTTCPTLWNWKVVESMRCIHQLLCHYRIYFS